MANLLEGMLGGCCRGQRAAGKNPRTTTLSAQRAEVFKWPQECDIGSKTKAGFKFESTLPMTLNGRTNASLNAISWSYLDLNEKQATIVVWAPKEPKETSVQVAHAKRVRKAAAQRPPQTQTPV